MPAATQDAPLAVSAARARLPVLDGLRGLAILLVLVNSLYPEGRFTGVDHAVELFTNLWWIGVDLFFALSGFLITGILCDARGESHCFRDFYARRALRIAPLYYGVLLALTLACVFLLDGPGRDGGKFLERQGWYWSYLVNVMMAREGASAATYGTGHFWSLSVEEQFYLVWPVLVAWLRPGRLARLCVALLAGALALRVWWMATGRSVVGLYVLTPTHADAILVGSLVALALRDGRWWARATRWARPVFATCAPLALALNAWGHLSRAGLVASYTIGFSLLALACGALLVLALDAPDDARTARLFGHRGMRFLGRYSYGIYVFSGLVDVTLHRTSPFVTTLPTVVGTHVPVATLVLLLASALSTALAYASYHLWERHWLRLKRFFPHAAAGPGRSA